MTAKDAQAELPVLVVDLDGTLILSDMLFESFWAGLADDWRTPFASVRALVSGRAALKRRLARQASVSVESLPFNEDVIARVRDWRASGGRAALVSASDATLVEAVADHLGLFDEVFGSDGETNLKGARKSRFLEARYGARGYAYIGDSAADLPVWRNAARAITANAPTTLRRRVAALGGDHDHIGAPSRRLAAYAAALRPHQWLKNVLVFVPMLAAQAFAWPVILQALLAFAAFSLVSSSVYVLNDLLDLRSDRAHPRKRQRPFAAGRVPIAHGTVMSPLLLLAGLGLAALAGGSLFLVLLGYFFLTTWYSLALKRRAIADICALAGLYTLRIVAGAVATGIGLSVWLLAFSIFFFFAMAAVKRQAELVDLAHRGVLAAAGRGYNVEDLPLVAQMASASGYVSVLVLALYLNAPGVQVLYSAPWLLWGICLVLLYWISRIVLITHRGRMDDDPVLYAVKDRTSLVCMALIAGFSIGAAVL
ncbi:UbiA family prenyltransferase [Roseovarius salinarum]|uniref:UbiA family prenyltransferase n=1 Tax=Roseovarius salinarum TaxID=1981892 RepID=UPI000C346756|nr:UbiA family prenyltransferase [Roseovarius salinarum]